MGVSVYLFVFHMILCKQSVILLNILKINHINKKLKLIFQMCSFTIKKYIDGTQLKPVLNTSFIKENVIDQATSNNIWEKLNNIKI